MVFLRNQYKTQNAESTSVTMNMI